jgi:hypothetical protein
VNLDGLPPEEVAAAIPIIRQRCEEIGRDPGTLRVSAHVWYETLGAAPSRRDLLAEYRETGVSRVITLVRESAKDPEDLDAFAGEARAAGCEMAIESRAL